MAELCGRDSSDLGQRVFGMCDRQISDRIKAACRHAGLKGNFSGHSPRVGTAADLRASGFSLLEVMQAGGWASPKIAARYTEGRTALGTAPEAAGGCSRRLEAIGASRIASSGLCYISAAMPTVNPEILVWARETAGLMPEEATKKLAIRDTKKATAPSNEASTTLCQQVQKKGREFDPTSAHSLVARLSRLPWPCQNSADIGQVKLVIIWHFHELYSWVLPP